MPATYSREQGESSADHFIGLAFMQPWPEQSDMTVWRQHLTIIPPVWGDLAAASQKLAQLAPAIKPITVVVIEQADLGAKVNQSLPVWLMGPAPVIRGLHKVCMAVLSGVVNLEDPTFTGEHFTPHITIHPDHPKLSEADRLMIASISLVQKIGNRQVIAKTIELGDA